MCNVSVAAKTGGTTNITIGMPVNFFEYTIENFKSYTGRNINNLEEFYTPAKQAYQLMDYRKVEPKDSAHFIQGEESVVLKEKWIYIFTDKGNRGFGVTEIFVKMNQEDKPEYEFVPWDEESAEKWKTTYPRTKSDKVKKKVSISPDFDNYFFISQVQIPFERVDKYRNDKSNLSLRSFLVPKNFALEGISDSLDIHLPDYMGISKGLIDYTSKIEQNLIDFLETLDKDQENEDEIARRQFAQMLKSLADKTDKVKDEIHYDKLIDYIEENDKKTKKLKQDLNLRAKEICDWSKTSGYKQMRDDYLHVEENLELLAEHESNFIEIIEPTQAGADFLDEVVNDFNSWHSQSLNKKENFESLFKKYKKQYGTTDKVLNWVANIYCAVLEHQIKLSWRDINKLEKVFEEKYKNDTASGLAERKKLLQKAGKGRSSLSKKHLRARKQLIQLEIESMLNTHDFPDEISRKMSFLDENSEILIYEFTPDGKRATGKSLATNKVAFMEYKAETLKDAADRYSDKIKKEFEQEASGAKKEADLYKKHKDAIESSKLKSISARILYMVDIVNLYYEAKNVQDTLAQGNTEKSVLAVTSAVSGFIGVSTNSEDLIKILMGDISTNVGKATAKKVFFRRLSVVGDLIGFGTSAYSLGKNIHEGKDGQVLGEALVLCGSSIALISSAATVQALIAGAALSELAFLGISAGGWGLIAVGLILAGELIKWLLRDRPLRDWAMQCPFNNDAENFHIDVMHDLNPFDKKEESYSRDKYQLLSKSDIDIQRQKLYEVLAKFDVASEIVIDRHAGLPNDHFTFNRFKLKITPGAFDLKKSKFWINFSIRHNMTVIWDTPFMVIDEKGLCATGNNARLNKDGTLKDVNLYWKPSDIRKLKSPSKELDRLLNNLEKNYWSNSDKENFEASWEIRLDYEGANGADIISKNYKDTGKMIFPVKEPVKNKKVDLEYDVW